MATPSCNYLFNFSSSYSGGGKQILLSYLEFFEIKGGATFFINKRLEGELFERYSNNKLLYVSPSFWKRLFNDGYYLKDEDLNNLKFDLFFSYGIPMYEKVGKKNWLHISNMIPVSPRLNYLGILGMLKMYLLRFRLWKFRRNIDIVSADSEFALKEASSFFKLEKVKEVVLKNGVSQNFLKYKMRQREQVAVSVGTQPYKDLKSLLKIFEELKKIGKVKKLVLIGDELSVPRELKGRNDVELAGIISHEKVMNILGSSQVYITSSMIENSSVAALEGAYLCAESYLSSIAPHKEMLVDLEGEYELVSFGSIGNYLHVTKELKLNKIQQFDWKNLNEQFYDKIREII